jgi:hypothetical protein
MSEEREQPDELVTGFEKIMGNRWWRRNRGVLNPDGSVRIVTNLYEWAQAYESSDNHLAQDQVCGFYVSTIFIGLDYSFGHGPPLWFETMVFREKDNDRLGPSYHQERYSTYQEALEGHARTIEAVKAGQIGE